ncbi:MAG TPA: CoA pyrophosphatase [Candidatus Dormibacteraeota bacterium]|jgi:8-oxo-dGTP pyrophosphatase MutT (NUDIX family)
MRELDGLPSNPFASRLSSLLQSFEDWGTFRTGAKEAAVVAILYRREGRLYMPFVARRTDLSSHPGQIGLPGGQVEPGESAWQAAAREAQEEIGVLASDLVPLGAGPPLYAAVTNYSVAAFVAWLAAEDVRFRPDTRELDAVLEVPLDHLLDESAWLDGPNSRLGRSLPVESAVIWGLTARLLAGILPPIRRALSEDAAGA